MSRILNIQNPDYGYYIANLWFEIGENLEHPAWEVIAEDAMYYKALDSSMSAHFSETTLSTEDYQALSDAEKERLDDLLGVMEETVEDISAGIQLDFDVWGWKEEEMQDAQNITRAVTLGMQAAYGLSIEQVPEDIEQ